MTYGQYLSPSFIVGALRWGTHVPSDDVLSLLDAAVDLGATTIDTANNYAFWVDGSLGNHSENAIGQWIATRGAAQRDRIAIATKVGARPVRPGAGFDEIEGLRGSAIRRQLIGSLERLRTDYVDVLYAHIDDADVALEETVHALQGLVQEGLVRRIAGSNLTADRLRSALDAAGDGPRYAMVQNRFTYLKPRDGSVGFPQALLDDGVLETAASRDVLPVGYSPLLSGAYGDPARRLPPSYRTERADTAIALLDKTSGELGMSPQELVLAWMVGRRQRVTPAVGVSSIPQLEAAIRATATQLPFAITDALDSAR